MNTSNQACAAGHTEIERKFRVKDDSYKGLSTRHVRIRQGYLALNEKCSVRVRLWDEQGYITIKGKTAAGHIARFEWEKPIPKADAEALLNLAVSGYVDKVRWLVPLTDALTCEVDEFLGLNSGLVLAEIELPAEDAAFPKPAFLGEDVSHDPRFFNSYLSLHPYSTW